MRPLAASGSEKGSPPKTVSSTTVDWALRAEPLEIFVKQAVGREGCQAHLGHILLSQVGHQRDAVGAQVRSAEAPSAA